MTIIFHDDYREAIRTKIIELKQAMPQMYSFQQVAKTCKVQKTYLSTVLGGNGHFNRDQLYLCCKFLGITEVELEFIELLYELQRSDCKPRRNAITEQLTRMRKTHSKTEQHIVADAILTNNLDLYYLNPTVQIVHVFTTIPRYAKNSTAIAEALEISIEKVNSALNALVKMGLIRIDKNGIHCLHDTVHLPDDSQYLIPHRKLLRLSALERQERLNPGEGYGLSVVFSSNQKVRDEIRSRFLEFLKFVKSEVDQGAHENVYQMNFDLFSWSKV